MKNGLTPWLVFFVLTFGIGAVSYYYAEEGMTKTISTVFMVLGGSSTLYLLRNMFPNYRGRKTS